MSDEKLQDEHSTTDNFQVLYHQPFKNFLSLQKYKSDNTNDNHLGSFLAHEYIKYNWARNFKVQEILKFKNFKVILLQKFFETLLFEAIGPEISSQEYIVI